MNRLLGTKEVVRLLLAFLLLGDACIDPLEIETSYLTPRLVVDGELTNEPGPYQVRLFYTTSIDSTTRYPMYESNAIVSIVDQDDNTEPLFEVSPGIYRTDESSLFRGQVGNSYYLSIIKDDGERLRSTTQELREEIPIAEMTLEFEHDVIEARPSNEPDPLDAFQVYITPERPVGRYDNVRWRSHGTYKGEAQPELSYIYDLRGRLVIAPPTCSGVHAFGNQLVVVGPCTCCVCWGNDYSTAVYLSDDIPANTQNADRVYVMTVPVTGMRFSEKYHIEVEQLTLSPDAYSFWKYVKIQQESGGGIFQPNSVKVRGNITSVSNPGNEVLGVFSVAGVSRKSLFLYPSDVPDVIPPIASVLDDCRVGIPNGVTERPPYW